MYRLVTVKFKNSSGRYDYLCNIEDVKRGDFVRVLTVRGEQVVEVVKVFWSEEEELEFPLSKYKSILGKAEQTPIKTIRNFEELQEFMESLINPQTTDSKNEKPISKTIPKSPQIIRDLYKENGSKITDDILQKLYDKAHVYWDAKDWTEAEAAYNTILELVPNDRGSIKALVTMSYFAKTRVDDSYVVRGIGRDYIKFIEESAADEHMTKAEKETEAFEFIRNMTAFAAKDTESFCNGLQSIARNKSRMELENRLDVVMASIEALYSVGVVVLKHFDYNKMLKKYVGFCIDNFLPLYRGIYNLNTGNYTNRYHNEEVWKCLDSMRKLVQECRGGIEEAPVFKLYKAVKSLFGDSEPDPLEGWDKENKELLLKDMKATAMKSGLSKIAPSLKDIYASFNTSTVFYGASAYSHSEANNNRYQDSAGNISQINIEVKKVDEIDDLITNPANCWHPMNLFYDDDD